MAKAKVKSGFFSELVRTVIHKKNQARVTRRVTAICIGMIFILGAMSLRATFLLEMPFWGKNGIPGAVGLLGCWIAFRAINYPLFADFLIAVEAEMDKVSWPDRPQLWRASVVVLMTMLVLGVALFASDLFWKWFFTLIKFLQM